MLVSATPNGEKLYSGLNTSMMFKFWFEDKTKQPLSVSEALSADFHNFLEKDFPFNEPGRTKLGVTCVGRQRKGLELGFSAPKCYAEDLRALSKQMEVLMKTSSPTYYVQALCFL